MRRLPFSRPGRFYRGNLHTHSDRSDGALDPAAVVAHYRDAGYDFLSVTDHFLPGERFGKAVDFIDVTDTSALASDGFLTIPGAEIHGPALSNGEPWHFVAVGLPLGFPRLGESETGPEVAHRARAAGAFVAAAHPHWYSMTLGDLRPVLPAIHAVETYNHACRPGDRAEGWYVLDELLGEGGGRGIGAIAADDAHFRDRRGVPPDALGGWVMVQAERLDAASIVAALRAGHHYSSTGPELHDVRLEGDELVVECSPVVSVAITGCGARSQRVTGPDTTSARFPIGDWRDPGYLRVTVRDEAGGRAWTNPVFLDD